MKKIFIIMSLIILIMSCLTTKEEPVVVVEPVVEPVVEQVEEPVPEPVVVEEADPDIYVATEEEYEETFISIEDFVSDLNKIISSGDYVMWKSFLSEGYLNKFGNKEFLAETSENPVLKDYGIKLRSLRDYFNYIVMPARSNVVVDEIFFESEDRIKAYTTINNKKIIVYSLIKTEESWIITE